MSEEDMAFMPNTTGNTNCGIPTPAHLYVGDVPWQYNPPPPPWYGQSQVPVMITTGTSTAQQVWPFNNVDELREFVKAIVRDTLEEDARELATNKAFQTVYVPAWGACWACGQTGTEMQWFTRGGRSHLIHRTEECRKLAEEKPETREHRG